MRPQRAMDHVTHTSRRIDALSPAPRSAYFATTASTHRRTAGYKFADLRFLRDARVSSGSRSLLVRLVLKITNIAPSVHLPQKG